MFENGSSKTKDWEKIQSAIRSLETARTLLTEVKENNKLGGFPCPLLSVEGGQPVDIHGGILAAELALAILKLEPDFVRDLLPELMYVGGVRTANIMEDEAEEIHRRLATPSHILYEEDRPFR